MSFVVMLVEFNNGWGSKTLGCAGKFRTREEAQKFTETYNSAANRVERFQVRATETVEFKGQSILLDVGS